MLPKPDLMPGILPWWLCAHSDAVNDENSAAYLEVGHTKMMGAESSASAMNNCAIDKHRTI